MDYLSRRVLTIVIHGNDEITGGVSETTQIRVVLAVIPQKVNGFDARVVQGLRLDHVPTVVMASVVDQDDFVRHFLAFEKRDYPINGAANDFLAIEHRDNDGVFDGFWTGDGAGFLAHISSMIFK